MWPFKKKVKVKPEEKPIRIIEKIITDMESVSICDWKIDYLWISAEQKYYYLTSHPSLNYTISYSISLGNILISNIPNSHLLFNNVDRQRIQKRFFEIQRWKENQKQEILRQSALREVKRLIFNS